MKRYRSPGRLSGVLIPLFSFPSKRSWGIGEIGDIAPMAAWLRSAGQRLLQLLPIYEMAPGDTSPYSAISAMAIDPLFISVDAVEDFRAIGGAKALGASARGLLAEARASRRVDYAAVRALKSGALGDAYERFRDAEDRHDTPRAAAFRSYVGRARWWLDDYALFRAVHARQGEQPWTSWSAGLASRHPDAIEEARRELEREVRFYQYLQWIAGLQWQAARELARPVVIYGDLPFMVATDSADVWARQQDFDLDASVGTPPDAFSATGQNWGVPVYRWDVLREGRYGWLRQRARRSAELYDGYRVDHMVGFYRTFVRPRDGGTPFFRPGREHEQLELGERLLAIFREAGAPIIAEDLGTIPDFVRASLARLGIPGYRVLRWEREYEWPGRPFRDPATYPAVSVATSGTHDTEPLARWWEEADADERTKVGAIPAVRRSMPEGYGFAGSPYTPLVRDALLEALFGSGSDLLVLPVQDIFGWRERVNAPATLGSANWTYRLPWFADELDAQPEAIERARALGRWSEKHGRS